VSRELSLGRLYRSVLKTSFAGREGDAGGEEVSSNECLTFQAL
jgi:hypothetical protein